jgi:hypothetical protein
MKIPIPNIKSEGNLKINNGVFNQTQAKSRLEYRQASRRIIYGR